MSWLMLVGWLLGWVLLWRPPRLREPTSTDTDTGSAIDPTREDRRGSRHRVSVVIPVRNEVDRIPRLLASLERQTRRPDQIVVVDDDSTDGTARVAGAFDGVQVIGAGPIPPGWTGKPNACAAGARRADGDLLVFLDADVVLGDAAIESLLATWAETGGLVSVQPHHRTERPFESLSLFFNVVAVMGLGMGSLVPPKEQWGAAGPCILTSRADYDRVGGHGAVAREVAEDLALAARYRHAGLGVHCYGGHDQVWFRMYRSGRDLFQGWGKNVATGARRTPPLRAMGVAIWITALASMAIALAARPDTTMGWATLGLIYLLGTLQVAMLGARVGRFGFAGLVWPVLIVVFLLIFGVSTIRTAVLRRVRWSGRSISLPRHV